MFMFKIPVCASARWRIPNISSIQNIYSNVTIENGDMIIAILSHKDSARYVSNSTPIYCQFNE